MAGEAVPCGAADAPRRVPALIATGPRRRAPGPRDERGALVPGSDTGGRPRMLGRKEREMGRDGAKRRGNLPPLPLVAYVLSSIQHLLPSTATVTLRNAVSPSFTATAVLHCRILKLPHLHITAMFSCHIFERPQSHTSAMFSCRSSKRPQSCTSAILSHRC